MIVGASKDSKHSQNSSIRRNHPFMKHNRELHKKWDDHQNITAKYLCCEQNLGGKPPSVSITSPQWSYNEFLQDEGALVVGLDLPSGDRWSLTLWAIINSHCIHVRRCTVPDRSKEHDCRMRSPERRPMVGTGVEKQEALLIKCGENPARIFWIPRVQWWMEAEIGVVFCAPTHSNFCTALNHWSGCCMVIGSSGLSAQMIKAALLRWPRQKLQCPRSDIRVRVGHMTSSFSTRMLATPEGPWGSCPSSEGRKKWHSHQI